MPLPSLPPPLASVAMEKGTDVLLRPDVHQAAGAGTNHASSNSDEAAAAATCCLCMEPWTSYGDHRICCLPCGHLYGRHCLEIWLRQHGHISANCPQCGQTYRHKDITNLWKDCCHRKEINELKLSFADNIIQMCEHQWQKMNGRFKILLNDQAAPLKALRKQVEALRKQMVKTKKQGAPATDCYCEHPPRKRKSHVLFAGDPQAVGTEFTKTNPAFSSSSEEAAATAMADQVTSLEALLKQLEVLRLREQTVNVKEQGEPATGCCSRHPPRKRRPPTIDALFAEVTKTNPAFSSSQEEAVVAAMDEDDGVEYSWQPPASTCRVCMQPWASSGDHQICCLPCGHVYGRCCLEKLLCPCGGHSAECPRCGQTYGHKDIINLCSTKLLWNDNCCHKEEIEEFKLSISGYIIMKGVKQGWRRHDRFGKAIDDQAASLEALRKQIGALWELSVKMKEQGAPATHCHRHHPRKYRPPAADVLFAGEFPQAMKTGVTKTHPAISSLSLCMLRWTSKDEHRFCSLPCGHLYHRCCLEKWLCPCGEHSTKCPQCGQTYGHKYIIGLFSTEHLCNDDGYHKEEIEKFKLSLVGRIIQIGERHWWRMYKQFEKVLNDQAASLEALRDQVEALRDLRQREHMVKTKEHLPCKRGPPYCNSPTQEEDKAVTL